MRSIVALAALALSGSVQLASAARCRPSSTTGLATTTTSTGTPVVTNELKGAKFARRGPDGGIVDFEGSGDAEQVDGKGYKGDNSKDNGCVQMNADSSPKRALGPNVGISQEVTGLNPSTPYTIRLYVAIALYPQSSDSCVIRAFLGGDAFYEQALFTSGSAAYSPVVKQASAPASTATFSVTMQCSGGNAAMIYVDSIFMSNQVTPQNIDDYDLDFGDEGDAGSPTTAVNTESQASATGTELPETETQTGAGTGLPETETAASTGLPETESQTVTGTEGSQTSDAETGTTTGVETSQTGDVETQTATGTETGDETSTASGIETSQTGDVETGTATGAETSDVETGTVTGTETPQTEDAGTGTTAGTETSQTQDAGTGTATSTELPETESRTVTGSETSQTEDVETGTVTDAQSTTDIETTVTSQEVSESTTASEEFTTTSAPTSTPTSEVTPSRICANVGSNPEAGRGCDRRPVTADQNYYFEFIGNIEKGQCAARCLAEEGQCGSFEYRYVNDCHKECRLYSKRLAANSPTGPSGDTNIWAYDRSCAWEIPCWQPPDDNVCLNKFADTAEQSCVRQKATLKSCAQPWLRLSVPDCTPEESCSGACATYTGCVAFSLSSDPDEQRNCLLYTDPVEEISDADDNSLLEFVNLSCYACRGEKMALTTFAQPMDDNTPKPDNTCAAPNNARFFLATPGAPTTLLTSTRDATATTGPNFA
ncbi:hypothetical protein ACHAPT_005110 [Fusarium lateritium]